MKHDETFVENKLQPAILKQLPILRVLGVSIIPYGSTDSFATHKAENGNQVIDVDDPHRFVECPEEIMRNLSNLAVKHFQVTEEGEPVRHVVAVPVDDQDRRIRGAQALDLNIMIWSGYPAGNWGLCIDRVTPQIEQDNAQQTLRFCA